MRLSDWPRVGREYVTGLLSPGQAPSLLAYFTSG